MRPTVSSLEKFEMLPMVQRARLKGSVNMGKLDKKVFNKIPILHDLREINFATKKVAVSPPSD